MVISDSAMDLIADLGYDPLFGARPLKRVIERELVNELAKQVLAGEFVAGETIKVDTDPKGFTFNEISVGQKTEKKEAKKKDDVAKLKKATKDVEDAVKKLKKEGGDENLN